MLVLFMIAIVSGAKKTSQKNGKISNNHKSMNEKENGEDYKDYDQDANPDDGKGVRKEIGNKNKIGKLEKNKKRREDSNSPVLINRIEWLNACSMSKLSNTKRLEIPGCGGSISFLMFHDLFN